MATIRLHVRVDRLWPFLWWMRLATALIPYGLTPERTVAIANRLLGLARVMAHDERGRWFMSPQPFTGRVVLTGDEDARQ